MNLCKSLRCGCGLSDGRKKSCIGTSPAMSVALVAPPVEERRRIGRSVATHCLFQVMGRLNNKYGRAACPCRQARRLQGRAHAHRLPRHPRFVLIPCGRITAQPGSNRYNALRALPGAFFLRLPVLLLPLAPAPRDPWTRQIVPGPAQCSEKGIAHGSTPSLPLPLLPVKILPGPQVCALHPCRKRS